MTGEVCREFGHQFAPVERNMERPQVCMVCGAKCFTAYQADGRVVVRHYVYPPEVKS